MHQLACGFKLIDGEMADVTPLHLRAREQIGKSSVVQGSIAKKGTLNEQSPFRGIQKLLFYKDCVLSGLGDAELYHFFGLDLDRFTSSGIAADTCFAIDQDELAKAWNGE